MKTALYRKLYIFIWAVLIIVTGTYIRHRSETSVPSIDPLILLQIILSMLAIMVSVPMIVHYRKLTNSLKLLFFYIAVAGLSSIFSPLPKLVFGYWVLFTGTSLLTAALVLNSKSEEDLWRIEDIWFFTVTFIVIKDSVISLLFSKPDIGDEVFRLGMGTVPPNTLGFMAAIAFWISFKYRSPKIIILLRFIFIVVIFLVQSRTAMACLILGLILKCWFQPSLFRNSSKVLKRGIYGFLFLGFLSAVLLAIMFHLPGTEQVLDYLKRDKESQPVSTLTGRTEIWPVALQKTFEQPMTLIFGHGYGISRYILNTGRHIPTFYAYHAHNVFLETLLSIGLLGLCAMVLIVLRSTQWFTRHNQLLSWYSTDYILRASSVVAMTLLFSITESELAVKIGPSSVIFFYYFLALGKSTKPALQNGLNKY
jgi:O-antigen ligase